MAERREGKKAASKPRSPGEGGSKERDAGTDESAPGRIPELLRKGLALGFSGLFMTEEAVRKAFGDTVPRDWIDFATEQSERTRSEFLERLAGELARSLETVDLVQILDGLLSGRTIEIKAQIHLGERTADSETPDARLSIVDERTRTR